MEPVYQVKLLAALRTGDPALVLPFLTEIGKDRRSSLSSSGLDSAAAALHLAVRCASPQTVALFLSNRAISANGVHPPGSGTTPLHTAASLARVDIVNLLLEQDDIDDTLRDDQGKTCRDVAKSRDVVRAIDDSRSLLAASYRSLLHSYIHSPIDDPPPPPLLRILNSPRASLLNTSYLDDDSGSSILHEAARRKDLRLIELAVRAGADVFLRNRRGKTAYESVKDDKVRVFLRQFANHDQSLLLSSLPASEPPALKGYLNKYTNVARGYSTRWFVLAHGVLSYYRRQEDESITSRGSISMKNALIKVNEHHRTRFEIHSLHDPPTTSSLISSYSQKWYIKSNHPVEAARWIQALNKSIEWARAAPEAPRKSFESDIKHTTTSLKHPRSVNRKSTTTPEDSDSINAALSADPNLSDFNNEQPPLSAGEGEGDDEFDVTAGTTGNRSVADDSSSADTGSRHQHPPHEDIFELQGNSILAQLEITQNLLISYFGGSGAFAPPSTSSSRSVTSAKSTSTGSGKSPGMLSNKSLPPLSHLPVPQPSSSPNSAEIKSTILESMSTLFTLTQEYTSMSREREHSFKKALAQEKARQAVWEESLATVVREGATLEHELRNRSRRRGSRVFGPGEGVVATFAKGTGFGSAAGAGANELGVLGEEGDTTRTRTIGRRSRPSSRYSTIKVSSIRLPENDQENALGVTLVASPPPMATSPQLPSTTHGARPRVSTNETIKLNEDATFYSDEDDEEDEFFDAIDSNNLPNLVVPPSLAVPSPMTSPHNTLAHTLLPSTATKILPTATSAVTKVKLSAATLIQPPPTSPASMPPFIDMAPYKSYEKLRTKLGLTSDDRPPTSLWSVLKHSIGKDLTRISFPVFFNEPTSMLQRMAEDMEFSECLDTAATERDSLKRLAYVAAFAMSNYSSTIGRIAKPFNPMLSETFEYVRLDKKYRYVSEQVSHHPPISACWAESPLWHYFGEVDAQNKFMGKSFEIRPTGVAHAELIIPESWIVGHGSTKPRGYSKAEGIICGEGKVVEHYTWKKVTTNVSGFILGSPTIDHYGDMVVVNHRTNEKCILTFKPRGWRGKDAYEISGQVLDARGRVAYEIAGRWNSQLIMRQVGVGGVLHPDTAVSSTSELSSDDFDETRTSTDRKDSISSQQVDNGGPEYILLWKNSPKPVGSPFNLTPFAITLNDCSRDELRPFLCPTDCRLRPDQRAFEIGKYDLANDLKLRQEEKQRSTRKEREIGARDEHRPRWFEARTDGDTGERVWMPKRVRVEVCVGGENEMKEEDEVEYWAEREKVWKQGGNQKWLGVEDIFIEEPEVMRT